MAKLYRGGYKFIGILLPIQVSWFMFASGYGIVSQYLKKGNIYFDGFLKNKVLSKLLLPYFVAILFHTAVCLVRFDKLVFPSTWGQTFLPNAWYIDVILLFYCALYIIYGKNSKLSEKAKCFLMMMLLCVYIVLCLGLNLSSTWYIATGSFALGIILAHCEKEKMCFVYWLKNNKYIVAVISFVVMRCFTLMLNKTIDFPMSGIVGGIGCSICLPLFYIACANMVKVPVPFLQWFGKQSLYLYLFHGTVGLWISDSIKDFNADPMVGVILCFLITMIISWIYQYVASKIAVLKKT